MCSVYSRWYVIFRLFFSASKNHFIRISMSRWISFWQCAKTRKCSETSACVFAKNMIKKSENEFEKNVQIIILLYIKKPYLNPEANISRYPLYLLGYSLLHVYRNRGEIGFLFPSFLKRTFWHALYTRKIRKNSVDFNQHFWPCYFYAAAIVHIISLYRERGVNSSAIFKCHILLFPRYIVDLGRFLPM